MALLSQHLALPRKVHIEQDLHILGYLKEQKKLRLMFNCGMPTVDERLFKRYNWIDFYRHATDPLPGNIPEARGLSVSISMFVDASHGGNVKYCQSHNGVFIFIKKAPINWYIKKKPSVETIMFGA